MDPNETLRDIRQCAAQAARGDDARRNERAIRWHFENLDRWLSSGGFLPDAWKVSWYCENLDRWLSSGGFPDAWKVKDQPGLDANGEAREA